MDRIMLLGRDHTELGEPALERLGPVAVALGRGRHPKAYHYLEPNEDALAVATDGDFVLMAVADGHNGTEASHAAIEAIHGTAPQLVELPPEEAVVEAARIAGDTLGMLPAPADDVPRSATTLTVAAVSGDRGAAAGWGDSVAVHLRGRRPRPLVDRAQDFRTAGGITTPPPRPTAFHVKSSELIVVATDGLVDFLPLPWDRSLARLLSLATDPDDGVRTAVRAAAEGGGGDNLAVCLFSLQV